MYQRFKALYLTETMPLIDTLRFITYVKSPHHNIDLFAWKNLPCSVEIIVGLRNIKWNKPKSNIIVKFIYRLISSVLFFGHFSILVARSGI